MPRVQGGELQDTESEEGAFEEGWGGGGEGVMQIVTDEPAVSKQIIAKCFVVIGAMIGVVPLAVFLSVPIYLLGFVLLWSTAMDRSKNLTWAHAPLGLVLLTWIGIIGINKTLGI